MLLNDVPKGQRVICLKIGGLLKSESKLFSTGLGFLKVKLP